MKPDEILREIRETAANILWRQWRGLGAMTNEREAQAIVDPEALLLASLALTDMEPRLPGVVHSWIWENAELMNMTRLTNLSARFPVAKELEEIARLAMGSGDLRWKTLAGRRAGTPAYERPKGRAIPAPLQPGAALMVRLRVGFGNGARADILAYLLGLAGLPGGERWASVATISDALSYGVAGIRRIADDLARARLIEQLPGVSSGRGPTARMFRARTGNWQPLLGGTNAQWRDWKETYLFVIELHRFARAAPVNTVTEYVLWTKCRELFEKYPKALPSDNSDLQHPPVDADDWPPYLEQRVNYWKSWASNAA